MSALYISSSAIRAMCGKPDLMPLKKRRGLSATAKAVIWTEAISLLIGAVEIVLERIMF